MYSEQNLKLDVSLVGAYLAISLCDKSLFNRYKNINFAINDFSNLLISNYTNSNFDYQDIRSQLSYLIKNRNSLAEIKYRIKNFGNIYNFVDFQSQTNDKTFNNHICNCRKVIDRILTNKDLSWADVQLFVIYTKWPKKCFVENNYIWSFKPRECDGQFYTYETIASIKKYIDFRLGEE
jgi:hypothetical protein